MPVLSTEKLLNQIWKMKSEPLSLLLPFYLFVSSFSEREKQQGRIAPLLSASRAATRLTHEHTNTHTRQARVCARVCGLVGVNLHVNEMALSALVSNSKSVKAKDAILCECVCVCRGFMFSCVGVCICLCALHNLCGRTRPGNPFEVRGCACFLKCVVLVFLFVFFTSVHVVCAGL